MGRLFLTVVVQEEFLPVFDVVVLYVLELVVRIQSCLVYKVKGK